MQLHSQSKKVGPPARLVRYGPHGPHRVSSPPCTRRSTTSARIVWRRATALQSAANLGQHLRGDRRCPHHAARRTDGPPPEDAQPDAAGRLAARLPAAAGDGHGRRRERRAAAPAGLPGAVAARRAGVRRGRRSGRERRGGGLGDRGAGGAA